MTDGSTPVSLLSSRIVTPGCVLMYSQILLKSSASLARQLEQTVCPCKLNSLPQRLQFVKPKEEPPSCLDLQP